MPEKPMQEIPIDSLVTRRQVREAFDEEELEGLIQSIKEQGVLQSLRARRDGAALVLVDGERRLRAAKRAGLATVPVIIESRDLSPAEVLQQQLVANCQHASLRPIEQATALQRLIDETKWSGAQVALKLGLSPPSVSRLLALLTLSPSVQAKVESGEIPASTAYQIARAGTAAEQERLAAEVAQGGLTRDAVSGRNRARKGAASPSAASEAARFTGKLPGGRTITLAGPQLNSLDVVIAWLEELLAKTRGARRRGVELATFGAVLKDEAKAAGGSS